RLEPYVLALGGGAVLSERTRRTLRERATTAFVPIAVDAAWERVRGSDRPLAQDLDRFTLLWEERRPLYEQVADAVAHDADDIVLAAAGVLVERGALRRLAELVPGDAATALISDPQVAGIHGMDAQLALGARLAETHDLPHGKNLVGAFHWPVRTVVDPALLETLPPEQRLEGMAEVVKTALLAGEPLHELPDEELVRRCAAFKAAVCLRDPHDHADRKQLNLGHTFAHALETAAGYEGLTHGRAVALGL